MTAGTFAALTQTPQVWLQNKNGWAKVRVKADTFIGGAFTIEAKLIATPEYRQKLAEAVAEALGVAPPTLTSLRE